jgi:hypothetical protein
VENRPGAGTVIAADYVAKSPPDGHTILMGTSTPLAINATLHKKLPYDPAKDFMPLVLATVPFVLVHWPRAWKVRLVHGTTPEWIDLYKRCFDGAGSLSVMAVLVTAIHALLSAARSERDPRNKSGDDEGGTPIARRCP